MKPVLGAFLLTLGVLLAVIGIGAMVADTYDTSRIGHIVAGLLWVLPGLALAALGWRFLRRRPER